jgi:hypothetical protein
VRSDLVETVGMPWRADDTGVVAAIGQHEGHLGVCQRLNLVNRTPGRNMVSQRADSEDGHSDVTQGHWPVVDLVNAFCQFIVEKELPQVFGMHTKRHARRVGIPGHQVRQWPALALQIGLHHR